MYSCILYYIYNLNYSQASVTQTMSNYQGLMSTELTHSEELRDYRHDLQAISGVSQPIQAVTSYVTIGENMTPGGTLDSEKRGSGNSLNSHKEDMESKEIYFGYEAYETGKSSEKAKYRLIRKKFKVKKSETTKVSLVVDDDGVHIHRMDGTPCVNIIYQEITSIDHRRDAKDLMGEKNFLAFRLRDSTSVIVSSADTRLIKNDVMKRVGPKLTVGSVLRNYSEDNLTEA